VQRRCFLDQVWRFDATTLIVDDPVKRVDNMPMAWALEVRTPFLDHELVELAARMPPELKLKEGGKFPLKAISRGLIPDSVIDRPKGYFPVPALRYVRGPFLEMMRDILLSTACIRRAACTSATTWTNCWRHPRHLSTSPASTAANCGIWPCWSGGYRCTWTRWSPP
jgi:asparagine synthetase B (glutamine-hydrolysing)